jgi:hypothetical protein
MLRWAGTCAILLLALSAPAAAAPDPPVGRTGKAIGAGRLGVELDGIGDGNRAKPFVDLARTLRPWTRADGSGPAPVDTHGWPTSDAETVLFDVRPAYTWAPPADDPDRFMPDWSGVYALSFKGSAVLKTVEDTSVQIRRLHYDPSANTTTGEIVVPKGAGLLILSFTQTRRGPSSPSGSGIAGLRVIRPGYRPDTRKTFTDEFIRSLKPFSVLRFMDWLDTNHNPGYYGDAGHHVLNWADRRLPTDATQQSDSGRYGVAWESVIELANETGKDLWINIPVAATDDYVTKLARLLKGSLNARLNVYVEDSNEVWNYGFPQYIYNKLAAIDEVKRGGSILTAGGSADEEIWARRRHAKRLIEIARICEKAFGAGSLNHRIRPVYASWVINPHAYFADVLKWVSDTYGPPKQFFYAVAGAAYFNAEKAGSDGDVSSILAAMRASSDEQAKFRRAIQRIADQYGLKHFQYEVGPDTGGGSTVNIANRIRANRDPRMRDLILHDARDNWFADGGGLYMYFSHCGVYSRHGCWGLSEDIADLATPKWKAVHALAGR